MWNLKKKKKECNKTNRLTDIKKKLDITGGRGREEWQDRGRG